METLSCPSSDIGFVHREIAGIQLLEFVMPPETQIAEHVHNTPHACFVVSGKLIEKCVDHSRSMHEGCLRLSPQGDHHRLEVGPEGATCLLVIGPDGTYASPKARVYQTDSREVDIVRQLRRNLHDMETFIQPTVQGIVTELFARGSRLSRIRTAPTIPSWLLETRVLIERELENPPSLAELAHEVGVHRVHLARAFRDHFGCTVGAYLRRVQINTARDLVLFTAIPLCEVALASGHADQAHMTRRFRAAFGSTPAAMRAVQSTRSDCPAETRYSRSRHGH